MTQWDDIKRYAEALGDKQRSMVELSLFPEREFSDDLGHIDFALRGKLMLRAEVVVIGGWGRQSQTWLWSWANDSFDGATRAQAEAVRTFGEGQELVLLSRDDKFVATEDQAFDLALTAAIALGARGVWRETPEDGSTDFFFAVVGIQRIPDPGLYAQVVEHLINETIVEGASAEKINLLREQFPEVRPSAIQADLRGEPNPWAFDLHSAPLFNLSYPPDTRPRIDQHQVRQLGGVNLSGARLDGANLRSLELYGARFDDAVLIDADLTRADLRNVSFRGAMLAGANFTRAALSGADFEGAEVGRTLFINTDLSEVRGLDRVHHVAASEIGLSTLIASHFKLERTFLAKAGVSRGLLEDLDRGQRFANTFQTCFLSYSTQDKAFTRHLYDALIQAGVRVFWDAADIVPGDRLEAQLSEAIREHDRLLVVLSPASLASRWVKMELSLVWHQRREALIPIRLCPIEAIKAWTEADPTLPNIADEFHIPDFSDWQDQSRFVERLSQLLRGLGASSTLGRTDRSPPSKSRPDQSES